jgi:hypothetical protein
MQDDIRRDSQPEGAGEAPRMGPFQRLWGVLAQPGKTFVSIDQRPTWLFPVIVLILVAIISSVLVADYRIQEARQKIAQNSQLTPEQREQIYERMDEQQSKPIMKLLSYVIGPIVAVFFIIFFVSAVLYFGGTVILGGETGFKKILAVYSWSSMVAIPALLLKTPLMLIKESAQVHTSLAALMPSGTEESILFKILTHTDLFTIWEIYLVSIGLAVVYRFTTRKAAGLVIGWYLFYVILAVAFSTLFGDRFMMG